MYLVSIFAVHLLLVFRIASAVSTESYESAESTESFEYSENFCDDENGTFSNAADECFVEMNLARFESIFKECSGVEGASGRSIYDWTCTITDEDMDKAADCADDLLKDQEEGITTEQLIDDLLNCTISKEYEDFGEVE